MELANALVIVESRSLIPGREGISNQYFILYFDFESIRLSTSGRLKHKEWRTAGLSSIKLCKRGRFAPPR